MGPKGERRKMMVCTCSTYEDRENTEVCADRKGIENMYVFEKLLNIEIGSTILWIFDNIKDRNLEGHHTVIAEFNGSGIARLTVKAISKIEGGWIVFVEEYPHFGIAFEDFGKTAFLDIEEKCLREGVK